MTIPGSAIPLLLAQSVADGSGYKVKRSARFNDGDSAYLNWQPSAAGNRRTWTWSGWVKRGTLPGTSANMGLFSQDSNCYFRFSDDNGGDSFRFVETGNDNLISERLFRDPSAFYHVVVAVDSTISDPAGSPAGSDRVKVYINNERITDWQTSDWPGVNHDFDINNAASHQIARCQTSNYFDGLMADIHFIDGQQIAATAFAETDSTTGQWVPKEYTGTYGTNGFHLAMDPANGGTDYSSSTTVSSGGFNGSYPVSNLFDGRAPADANRVEAASNDIAIDITFSPAITVSSTVSIWSGKGSVRYQINNSGSYTTYSDAVGSYKDISHSGSLTNLKILHGSAGNAAGLSAIKIDGKQLNDHTTIGYDSSGKGNTWIDNNLFGREHTTASENFKAVTYTGNATAGRAINCGFAPDFVWIKRRNSSGNHTLWPKSTHPYRMHSDGIWEEGDGTTALSAFTSTGVTLGSHIDTNANNDTYVAWFWKGGGTSSALNTGTIDATVSANTTGGFSVVNYEGTGSNGTVAHGLGKAADFIIVKNRDSENAWSVYHSSIGHNGGNNYLELQSTGVAGADNTAFQDTAPTSTVFSIGTKPPVNTDNENHVALCWAETADVSKFGSYSGGTNPKAIDCGFKPAFVIIKRTDTANYWMLIDSVRGGTQKLAANSDVAENDTGTLGDASQNIVVFEPNGFKLTTTNAGTNTSGGTYIYAAFAGHPGGDLDLLADTPAPYDNELNGGGNYCTLNPLQPTFATTTLSNGNLDASIKFTNGSVTPYVVGNFSVSSGKWYWETKINQKGNDTEYIGWMRGSVSSGAWAFADIAAYFSDARKAMGGSPASYGASYGTGDIIGFALDADNGDLTFYKNGVSQGAAATGMTFDSYKPFISANGTSTEQLTSSNFGQRTFAYTPPAGYKALNTYNLPDPTVVKGNAGFDTKLYDGNSGTQTISGLNLSPDLVWIKQRNATASHFWYDTVRGTQKLLSSNYEGLENWAGGGSAVGELTAFTSDGFTIVNSGSYGGNVSGGEFVAWNWDAADAESNTAISAGGLNSVLYDQSQTWSNAVTGTLYSGQSAATVFNNTNSGSHAAANNTLTFTTPGGVTLSGTVEIHMARGTGASSASGDYDVKVNGTSVFNHSTMPYNTNGWVNLGSHTLSTLSWGCGSIGNDWIQLNRIKVGGKELVDNGVSLDNVPTLASEYRVNPDTGFSIVTFTDGSTNGLQSIAHGLNDTPAFIILKDRDANSEWSVFHKSFPSDALYLHLNNAKFNSSRWNGTAGTSNVFYWNDNSTNSNDLVAFLWSEVTGYSKFGSYTASSSNPFIYCGFRPAFLMIKCTSHTGNWGMWDDVRSPYNTVQKRINAQSSGAEYDNGVVANDFLSNGFKVQTTDTDSGGSGRTYIFCAFAESPFKYANAR